MKKIRYSNFESIKEIIMHLDLEYVPSKEENKQKLFDEWENIVGKKLASVSKPIEINSSSVLIISCANSFIANELFMSKNNLLELLDDKIREYSLDVKDIRFEYKNWVKK